MASLFSHGFVPMVFRHGKFLVVFLSVAVIFIYSFFTFIKSEGILVIPMVLGSYISKHSIFVENMQRLKTCMFVVALYIGTCLLLVTHSILPIEYNRIITKVIL